MSSSNEDTATEVRCGCNDDSDGGGESDDGGDTISHTAVCALSPSSCASSSNQSVIVLYVGFGFECGSDSVCICDRRRGWALALSGLLEGGSRAGVVAVGPGESANVIVLETPAKNDDARFWLFETLSRDERMQDTWGVTYVGLFCSPFSFLPMVSIHIEPVSSGGGGGTIVGLGVHTKAQASSEGGSVCGLGSARLCRWLRLLARESDTVPILVRSSPPVPS